jgi:hypothetical protein
MRKIAVALLAIITALAIVAGALLTPTTAQDGQGGIAGTVYAKKYNRPVKDVYVILESGAYHNVKITEEDGRYEFHPPQGTYNLTFVYKDEVVSAT